MKGLERFFIDSPLGWLEAGLRGERLFFVSKARPFVSRERILTGQGGLYKGQNKLAANKGQSQKIINARRLSPLAKKIKRQIESYFKGQLKNFDIPLAGRGTGFQKKVWRELKKIPYGETQTYKEIAARAKSPKAFRAVGCCCAANPFLLVVPCHRVLSQNGLGGFALGLKAKKYLLSLEAGQS